MFGWKVKSWCLVEILKMNLIKICVWTCDTTSRSYFNKMNSTLGSVVPLAMFSPFHLPRVFPILWTLVCPLIDETSRAKFLFYATDGQRGDQLAAQSAGLRWGSWNCFQRQVWRENFDQGLSTRGQDPWLAGRTCPDSNSRGWPRPQVLLHVQPGAFPSREQEMARQCFQYSRSLKRIRARGLTWLRTTTPSLWTRAR